MDEARGLGYLYVGDRYSQTGGLFPTGSIGHCGHTGQSIFVDPKSGLYVIVLSDATVSTIRKYGKENYNEVMQMRHDIHAAIKADLN
jgi:CubicO group peptidase (beta-lactamase class C family)